MSVLPGVLGYRILRRTFQVRLGSNPLRLPGGTPIFTVSRHRFVNNSGYILVGTGGFEPPAPCSQGRCADQTALRPEHFSVESLKIGDLVSQGRVQCKMKKRGIGHGAWSMGIKDSRLRLMASACQGGQRTEDRGQKMGWNEAEKGRRGDSARRKGIKYSVDPPVQELICLNPLQNSPVL